LDFDEYINRLVLEGDYDKFYLELHRQQLNEKRKIMEKAIIQEAQKDPQQILYAEFLAPMLKRMREDENALLLAERVGFADVSQKIRQELYNLSEINKQKINYKAKLDKLQKDMESFNIPSDVSFSQEEQAAEYIKSEQIAKKITTIQKKIDDLILEENERRLDLEKSLHSEGIELADKPTFKELLKLIQEPEQRKSPPKFNVKKIFEYDFKQKMKKLEEERMLAREKIELEAYRDLELAELETKGAIGELQLEEETMRHATFQDKMKKLEEERMLAREKIEREAYMDLSLEELASQGAIGELQLKEIMRQAITEAPTQRAVRLKEPKRSLSPTGPMRASPIGRPPSAPRPQSTGRRPPSAPRQPSTGRRSPTAPRIPPVAAPQPEYSLEDLQYKTADDLIAAINRTQGQGNRNRLSNYIASLSSDPETRFKLDNIYSNTLKNKYIEMNDLYERKKLGYTPETFEKGHIKKFQIVKDFM
jgi:hypothetical protein